MSPAPSTARRAPDLAAVLVRRDLRLAYGGAAFGLLWAPATVLVQTVALAFLFRRVVPLGIDDYPAFLLGGLVVWHLVSTALNGSAGAFRDNADLVRRPGFPDAVLPLVAVGRSLAGYALSLPVVVVALAVAGRVHVTALALPLVVLATLLLLVGPAFVIATLDVRRRDVGHLVRVGMGVLFYVTPVFYPEERIPEGYAWVSELNPVAGVVTLHRQVLFDGAWPDVGRLATVLAFALVGIGLGAFAYRRAARHLADDL